MRSILFLPLLAAAVSGFPLIPSQALRAETAPKSANLTARSGIAAAFSDAALHESRSGEVRPAWWWNNDAEDGWVPLKEVASGSGVLVGSIYNELRVWDIESDEDIEKYENLLADNFDVITPENGCKTEFIFPTPDSIESPNFDICDRVFDWAAKKGIKVRYHVSAWGDWNPEWIVNTPADKKAALLEETVRIPLERYKDHPALAYVDVVNEVVCDKVVFTPQKRNCQDDLGLLKGGPGVSAWYPEVEDFFDRAFITARNVLQNHTEIKLVFNDYNCESTHDPVDSGKADRVYEFVKAAVERGVPIDAVGLQTHISTFHAGTGTVGSILFRNWLEGVPEVIRRFGELGLEVHFTEIDVGCNFPTLPCPPEIPFISDAGEERQASVYAGLLQACLDDEACTVYQMWGSTDRYSWRDGSWSLEDAGGTGSDSLNQKAHIFDAETFAPKKAAWALADTFNGAKRRVR